MCRDVPAAVTFYTEVMGLTQNFTRPDFGFPGAWFDAGEGQMVHLIEAPAPPNLGQHFALLYDSVEETVDVPTRDSASRSPIQS